MMSREQMIAIVRSEAPASLLSEIDYHLHDVEYEVEEGTIWDELSTLFEVLDFAETNGDRKTIEGCRRLLIRLGFFRVMTQREIESTWVSSGSKWSFKLGGQPYTTDFIQENWQFGRLGWQEAH